MANIIGRVHKLGKKNIKQPDMITDIIKVPVSISFSHNTNDKNIDMTLNSSSTTTLLSTITAAAHEKPAESIEKKSKQFKKGSKFNCKCCC